MQGLLGFIGRNGPRFLAVGVFLGLFLPQLAAFLRPALAPAVVLLLLLALLRVDWDDMAAYARRPGRALLLITWMMLVSPLLFWSLSLLLDLPQALQTALILMAAAPPILGATAIAMLLGLDGALAVLVGLTSTLLTPLTVPPLALGLLGLEIDLALGPFMLRLTLLVLSSFVGAFVIRRLLGTARTKTYAQQVDGLVVITMLVFAVAIMDGVTQALLTDPLKVFYWFAAAMIANPLLQLLGAAAFWWMGSKRALTAGLLSGNCNMGLLLAAMSGQLDPDIALYFSIAQLPMYILPVVVLPLYRKIIREPFAQL
jgi:BASS family bile acid:Na+ symporter|tara:strand:- start:938 stop:1879 length:942 start_codon:yes stop_codon:yes gene_type:complete